MPFFQVRIGPADGLGSLIIEPDKGLGAIHQARDKDAASDAVAGDQTQPDFHLVQLKVSKAGLRMLSPISISLTLAVVASICQQSNVDRAAVELLGKYSAFRNSHAARQHYILAPTP
jgi:hypothetical protein